jgi:hypothetical protein
MRGHRRCRISRATSHWFVADPTERLASSFPTLFNPVRDALPVGSSEKRTPCPARRGGSEIR